MNTAIKISIVQAVIPAKSPCIILYYRSVILRLCEHMGHKSITTPSWRLFLCCPSRIACIIILSLDLESSMSLSMAGTLIVGMGFSLDISLWRSTKSTTLIIHRTMMKCPIGLMLVMLFAFYCLVLIGGKVELEIFKFWEQVVSNILPYRP